jgi:hypothetical protein
MHRRVRVRVAVASTTMVAAIFAALVGPIGVGAAHAAPVKGWTLFVGSDFSKITPIDTTKKKPGTPIPVGNGVGPVAVTPDGSTAYVLTDDGIVPIDEATDTAEATIPVESPVSIAIAPDGATAYVASGGVGIVPIDLTTDTVEPPITDENVVGTIAIAPDGATAYVVTGLSLVPVDLTTDTAEAAIPLPADGVDIAITPDGSTAYLTSPTDAEVLPVDLATGTAEAPIPLSGPDGEGAALSGITIAPNGLTAYVVDDTAVAPVDLTTGTAETPIQVENIGFLPLTGGVTVSPNGSTVYVATTEESGGIPGPTTPGVTPIDTATDTVEKLIPVPDPQAIAISPDQAPVARLSVKPKAVGKATRFDASRSTVAVGSIVSYAWNFGDGTMMTTSKPVITHTYGLAGTYTASVTETDSAGTSTTQTFTGQTVSQNGGPSALASQTFTVKELRPGSER